MDIFLETDIRNDLAQLTSLFLFWKDILSGTPRPIQCGQLPCDSLREKLDEENPDNNSLSLVACTATGCKSSSRLDSISLSRSVEG